MHPKVPQDPPTQIAASGETLARVPPEPHGFALTEKPTWMQAAVRRLIRLIRRRG
jgi:hypothetical protein